MGAKQSKRSVDISGKEAENVGEVAVAGAGGEGRMEALADADALKPQINGDAHIHEQSDKEKQLDSGTPENEKDATTEKEGKEQEDDKEKEAAPVANGENGEQKENGESTPAPEDGKKPKKEKVKKKWSLRSISFSRKEKPKQEKKQKEEEPKTNGEPEKVPEEAAETAPETPKTEVAEESKPETESKDDKTPETPVTEPITNGSSTPESKAETPAAEEPAAVVPETNRPEEKAEPEPEQLPVNGLSLEEAKNEPAEEPKIEESKPEELAAETTESVPAPEIPVKKEVCVEQLPIEPTPPPLPANPPPSSVASFAATTMAPELTDASLVNTADSVIIPPPTTLLDTQAELPVVELVSNTNEHETSHIATESNPQPPTLKEVVDVKVEKTVPETPNVEADNSIIKDDEAPVDVPAPEPEVTDKVVAEEVKVADLPAPAAEVSNEVVAEEVQVAPEIQNIEPNSIIANEHSEADLPPPVNETGDENAIEVVKIESDTKIESVEAPLDKSELIKESNTELDTVQSEAAAPAANVDDVLEDVSEPCISPPAEPEIPDSPEALDSVEDLPPPPPVDDFLAQSDLVESLETAVIEISEKAEVISNHVSEITSETNGFVENFNGGDSKEDSAPLKHKKEDSVGKVLEAECNGAAGAEPGAPAPLNGDAHSPQDTLPVSDKIADLIPEVPVVPELKTESETASEVALAN